MADPLEVTAPISFEEFIRGFPQEKQYAITRMLENKHFSEVVLACWDIYDRKGQDYTRGKGESDRLDNFKMAAENNDVTFLQAWGVYFYKHVAAVWKFVKDGQVESEPIEGRLYDVINYVILLLLWIDDEHKGGV